MVSTLKDGKPMDSKTTFKTLCKALDFYEKPGLVMQENVQFATQEQTRILRDSFEKFGVDAIYFIKMATEAATIPVIYFKKLESPNPNLIQDLHRRIWNLGKVPLLFVILPGEIKIYNCFASPPEKIDENLDSEARLLESLNVLTNIQQKLKDYSRQEIDSGIFWQKNWQKFAAENRVDKILLKNLRMVCDILYEKGLPYKHVHSLLGRSIFILYLQDRKALDKFSLKFENSVFEKFVDILPNKELTYRFFKKINAHFNGDMFPLTPDEEDIVTVQHLNVIHKFLLGTDLETGQTRLWPYSFDVIPIEFISSIYEEFFHHEKEIEKESKNGTHYTRQFLVEFILNEILPWNKNETNIKILDPACGSGIFLVEAYRRLIERWKIANNNEQIDYRTLTEILKNNIYGIDINEEAIRIAAFSLYLTMLDYLEPKSIWTNVRFPSLRNENLFANNFFDEEANFNNHKFKIIVGNPPWGSDSSETGSHAISYCRKKNRPIGDKQIAQAFLWRASDLCAQDGEISFIVTAKGLLFNRSNKNREFRKNFFKTFDVRTIVNLSLLRHYLFDKSVGPPAVVFYRPKQNNGKSQESQILYIVPKTTLESRQLEAIIIDQSNLRYLPTSKVIEDDTLWKIAMWGTPRDANLISQSRQKGMLKDVIEKFQWEIGDGFQAGGGDENPAPWMRNYPFLPSKSIRRFHIPHHELQVQDKRVFHRHRNKRRFSAPLCLVKVTLRKGQIVAAHSDSDVCYTDGIIGISGLKKHDEMLKIIACYLNSNLARYFLFLNASVWGVERDDILKDDLLNLPFIMPEVNSNAFNELIKIYDELNRFEESKKGNKVTLLEQIDTIFFNIFSFSESEIYSILDTINYSIDHFQKKENSIGFETVDNNLLLDYANAYSDVLNAFFGHRKKSLDITIYSGEMPLQVVSFTLINNTIDCQNKVIYASNKLQDILKHLDSLLLEEHSEGIYIRRNVRIYDGNTIYIIKPNESRYWTRSTGFNDADETSADIFETWKEMR